MSKSKAIISFGVGYGFHDVRYFVQSCHLHAGDADVFIFVGDNAPQLQKQFADFPNVHFVTFKESLSAKIVAKAFSLLGLDKVYARALQALFAKLGISRWLTAMASPLVQFMVKRFFVIHRFMKTLPHRYIMFTDLRDVLLQSDPFAALASDRSIMTGIEPVSIAQSEMNKRWITKTYPLRVAERLLHLPVICAGVTIGTREAMQQYVNEMIYEAFDRLHRIVNMLGADQAIHIKLFYQGLYGLHKNLEANGRGTIATLHFSKLEEFSYSDGLITNRDGKKLAVVHQYDRHLDLSTMLRHSIDRQYQELTPMFV